MLEDRRWKRFEYRNFLVIRSVRLKNALFHRSLSRSHLFSPLQTSSHLFTHHADQTVRMYAHPAIAVSRSTYPFRKLLFVSLTSDPAEMTHFSLPNLELSNGVRLASPAIFSGLTTRVYPRSFVLSRNTSGTLRNFLFLSFSFALMGRQQLGNCQTVRKYARPIWVHLQSSLYKAVILLN